jgi:RHS repeat-associated protein
VGYVYDFENHVIQAGAGITMVYDGDGNRVQKTVAGVTTKYLVDTQSPTGFAQVVYETFSGSTATNRELSHTFVYGLERISQLRSYLINNTSQTQTSYYVYDGHGSTRALTDPNGAATDTYDYDAFGNLLHSTGTTANEFLFAGEQFDSDLNLYYNRARYLNVSTGRFWSMDVFEGRLLEPPSLHKYFYTEQDPANGKDPAGNQLDEETGAATLEMVEDNIPTAEEAGEVILEGPPPSAPPTVGPPPTIPNLPVPVSFGSVIGRAVIVGTALALATHLVSDNNPLPPTQPRSGDEGILTVYRDASGPSPSDFRIDPSRFTDTGFEVSTLQQPRRNKRFVVPFTVIYDKNKPFVEGLEGVVSDPLFVDYVGIRPIIYSPSEGPGHWSLEAPSDPAAQTSYQQGLAAYGKKAKQDPNLIP